MSIYIGNKKIAGNTNSGGADFTEYKLVDGYVLDKDDNRVLFSDVKDKAKFAIFTDGSTTYGRVFRYEAEMDISGAQVIILKCGTDINPDYYNKTVGEEERPMLGSYICMVKPTDEGYTEYTVGEYGAINSDPELRVAASICDTDGKTYDIMTGNGIAKVLKKANGESDIPTTGNDVIQTIKDIVLPEVVFVNKLEGDDYIIPDLTKDNIIAACTKFKDKRISTMFRTYQPESGSYEFSQVIGAEKADTNYTIMVSVPGEMVYMDDDSTPSYIVKYTYTTITDSVDHVIYKVPDLERTVYNNLTTGDKRVISAINELKSRIDNISSEVEHFEPYQVFQQKTGDLLSTSDMNSNAEVFVTNGVAYANLYFTKSIASSSTGWKQLLHWNTGWKYKIDNSFKVNCAYRCVGSMWANNKYVNMAFDCYPDDASGMSTVGLKSYYYTDILNQTGGINMSLSFPVVPR